MRFRVTAVLAAATAAVLASCLAACSGGAGAPLPAFSSWALNLKDKTS